MKQTATTNDQNTRHAVPIASPVKIAAIGRIDRIESVILLIS
jgi:hypothetical protein